MTTTWDELIDKSTLVSGTAIEHFFSMARGSLISEYEVELMDDTIDIEIEEPTELEIADTSVEVEITTDTIEVEV